MFGTPNAGEVVKRYAKGKLQLWLFVDDIDKNFENSRDIECGRHHFLTPVANLPISSQNCISDQLSGPTFGQPFDLSLSHCPMWSSTSSISVGARMKSPHCWLHGSKSYLKRNQQWQAASEALGGEEEHRKRQIIATVFESPILWGGRGTSTRPPHVALYTLSKHRPRWVVELAKVAAAEAVKKNHKRIARDDIFDQLEKFGRRKIEDTVAEFKSQCPDIEELVAAFAQQKEQMSTAELIKLIDNKESFPTCLPGLESLSGKASSLQVAALLFEIGLYYARRQRENGEYEHFDFSNRPSLFEGPNQYRRRAQLGDSSSLSSGP